MHAYVSAVCDICIQHIQFQDTGNGRNPFCYLTHVGCMQDTMLFNMHYSMMLINVVDPKLKLARENFTILII